MNVILWAWRHIAGGVRAEIDEAKAIIAEEQARNKPPAPGRTDTWPPGGHAAGPRPSASVPAPGPIPAPGHDSGAPVFGIVIWDCECAYALSPRTLQWRQANHCGRTDFNTAEWEHRLRTGPRDGESLAEWERRIEP